MSMTIAQMIKLSDDLRAALDIDERLKAYEVPPSVLPAGCPLYTTVEGASELYSISQVSIRNMIRRYADFPAARIGTKIIIDVPGLYEWLHAHNGDALDVTPQQ